MKTPFKAPQIKSVLPPDATNADSAALHRALADGVNGDAITSALATATDEITRSASAGRYSTAVNIAVDHLAETMQARLLRAGYSARIQGRLLVISWA